MVTPASTFVKTYGCILLCLNYTSIKLILRNNDDGMILMIFIELFFCSRICAKYFIAFPTFTKIWEVGTITSLFYR